MLEDSSIIYKNQHDQKICDFLQKVGALENYKKNNIFLIPPFLPQHLGKINLVVDTLEMNFANIREKGKFFNEIKNHFGNEEVNVHNLAAIEEEMKYSKVTNEYAPESLEVKLKLSELALDKDIDFQWNEKKLKENTVQNKKQKIEEDLAQQKKETNTDSPLREQEQFREFCELSEEEFNQFLSIPEEVQNKIIHSVVGKMINNNPSKITKNPSAEKVFDPKVLKQQIT